MRARGAQDRPKQRALLDGALAVFAEDGYSRASIDEIARRAGVSSRTIYNQHAGKAALFEAVIVDSAQRVARAQTAAVDRVLGAVPGDRDVRSGLVEFGLVWATPDPRFARHFAIVRQVDAEIGHVPPAAVRAWQDAGPRRVRRQIVQHLQRIAGAGLLQINDPEVAAAHLIDLVTGEIARRRLYGPRLSRGEVDRLVEAGVTAFLSGYGR